MAEIAEGAVMEGGAGHVRVAQDGVSRSEVLRLAPRGEGPLEKVRALVTRPTVTVSVDSGTVRLVAFRGKRVVAWATLSTGPETVGRGDLAERVHMRLRRLGVRRPRFVADLPLNSGMVRTVPLTKVPSRYTAAVTLAELADVLPFSSTEMTMRWQSRKRGDTREVVATTVLESAVHERVRALAGMGARARGLYLRTVALAHAAGIADGVIIHMAESWAELVFMSQGVPLFVQRTELQDLRTPLERSRRIAASVAVLRGYVLDSDVEVPDQDGRIVLTGPRGASELLRDALSQALQRDVEVLVPAVAAPSHFPAIEYAVNVGLARAHHAAGKPESKIAAGVIPSLDMLPVHGFRGSSGVRPFAFLGLIVFLGIAGTLVSDRIDVLAQEAGVLERRVDTLSGQDRTLRLKDAQARTSTQRLATLATGRDALVGRLDAIKSGNADLVARLQVLTEEAVPPGLTVTSLTQRLDVFSLAGIATDYRAVLTYAANIRDSGRFGNVRAVQAALNESGATFQIEASASTP